MSDDVLTRPPPPILGVDDSLVPFSDSLVTIVDSGGRPAESIRALRTHLMAQHFQRGRRALAVCGASAGVGCTFTAVNLAVALSQIGMETLLVDADLRHPSVQNLILPAQRVIGLRGYLEHPGITFAECMEADVMPGLSVAFGRAGASNPHELLACHRFQAFMDYCLREHDATIIDTPPANSCSDARRVSTVVGYSVIIARRDATFVEDIRVLTSQLQADHAEVVGTVLNEA